MFNSPMFMPTAIYTGIIPVSIILLMTIVLNMNESRERDYILVNKVNYWIECFEEFTLSIFTIISGAYIYYCFESSDILQNILGPYATIIMLVIIAISVLVMNMISNNFSPTISTEEKTSLRLLGSIYAVINLIIIRIIVSDTELDAITICYIGLLLGRFIFFDTSISSIIVEFKNIGRKAILLIIMGVCVSFLLFWYKKNGVDIVGNNMIFQFSIIYCAMIFGLKAAKNINTKIYL